MPKNISAKYHTRNENITIKGLLRLGLYLGFLVLVLWIVLEIAVVPKDPITSQQAWDIMVQNGYHPQDVTEQYYEEDVTAKTVLKKCIAFETADIHFVFYEFNNKSSAIDLYSQAHAKIIQEKITIHAIETGKQIANYSIFGYDDHDTYNVAIYVENTAVYAYSDSESKLAVNAVLDAMDYLE